MPDIESFVDAKMSIQLRCNDGRIVESSYIIDEVLFNDSFRTLPIYTR